MLHRRVMSFDIFSLSRVANSVKFSLTSLRPYGNLWPRPTRSPPKRGIARSEGMESGFGLFFISAFFTVRRAVLCVALRRASYIALPCGKLLTSAALLSHKRHVPLALPPFAGPNLSSCRDGGILCRRAFLSLAIHRFYAAAADIRLGRHIPCRQLTYHAVRQHIPHYARRLVANAVV